MKKKTKLSAEAVRDIYEYCQNKDSVEPLADYAFISGYLGSDIFDMKRINEKREQIAELIAQLPDMSEPLSMSLLTEDRQGRGWGSIYFADYLIKLGIASGELEYTFPAEVWPSLPYGLPVVQEANFAKAGTEKAGAAPTGTGMGE